MKNSFHVRFEREKTPNLLYHLKKLHQNQENLRKTWVFLGKPHGSPGSFALLFSMKGEFCSFPRLPGCGAPSQVAE